MFSLQYMHRQFTSRRFDQLLKSVMHNGMQLPAELQNHLLNHPVCSVALSLRRTLELSYGPPDSQTRQMVEFLLQTQEDNGSFGFAPLPTACGLAALTQILQNAPQGSPPAQRPQALHQAQTRARTALDEMIQDQATHGLPQTSLQDTPLLTESDAMDWAFILQLLSDDITWEENPAIEKLHHWFHANTNQLPTQILKLWHRACWTPTPTGSFNTETTPGSFDTGIPTTGSFSTKTTPPAASRPEPLNSFMGAYAPLTRLRTQHLFMGEFPARHLRACIRPLAGEGRTVPTLGHHSRQIQAHAS